MRNDHVLLNIVSAESHIDIHNLLLIAIHNFLVLKTMHNFASKMGVIY